MTNTNSFVSLCRDWGLVPTVCPYRALLRFLQFLRAFRISKLHILKGRLESDSHPGHQKLWHEHDGGAPEGHLLAGWIQYGDLAVIFSQWNFFKANIKI